MSALEVGPLESVGDAPGREWYVVCHPPPKHFLPNRKKVTKDSSRVPKAHPLFAHQSLLSLSSSFSSSSFNFFFVSSFFLSQFGRKREKPIMENSAKPMEGQNQNPSLVPSPNSHSTNSSSSSSSNSNGLHHPPTPKPITRSESNPYPTTFVQADTSSFKQVVQMLTGSSETAKQASAAKPASDPRTHIPPIKTSPKKQPGFKLYERRNSLKNLKLSPLIPGFVQNNSGFSPPKPEILSPSMLDFPALVLSPVTPLIPDPFNRSPMNSCSSSASANANLDSEAEEKAIAEKGFFLHPSPATTPRDSEPRLLSLFPMTSPRVPGSSTSS